MRLATVGVSDLHQALGLFHDLMRLKIERRGPVPAALLKAWHLPARTKAHMVELSCKGYPLGRLRLVAFEPPPRQAVRRDFGAGTTDSPADVGPKALHFYVADPILPSVRKIEAGGFRFRSRPVRLQVETSLSEECLFSGPDDVPLMVMVGMKHPPTRQRPGAPDGPVSEIAAASIIAGDLARTRGFYEGVLGLTAVTDVEIGEGYRDEIADLFGLPRGTRVRLLQYAHPGEASGKIMLVHLFERTGKRLSGRMKPGHLGFSLLTHQTDDLKALSVKLRAVGADIVTPPMQIDGDGAPYRVMLAKGPNEEMFEFVQAGAGAVAKSAARRKVSAKAKAPAKKARAKPKAKTAVKKAKARPKTKTKAKAKVRRSR